MKLCRNETRMTTRDKEDICYINSPFQSFRIVNRYTSQDCDRTQLY